jgi:hypothetical protein
VTVATRWTVRVLVMVCTGRVGAAALYTWAEAMAAAERRTSGEKCIVMESMSACSSGER